MNKSEVLGMAISKAAHRLNRDLIYTMGKKLGLMVCYRCGGPISREDFTIDHKVDWLHSDDPVTVFFDLDNIAFSHHRCNAGAGSGGQVSGDIKRKSPEYHKQAQKEYRHTEKYKEYRRSYEKGRYASDTDYRQYYLDKDKNKRA